MTSTSDSREGAGSESAPLSGVHRNVVLGDKRMKFLDLWVWQAVRERSLNCWELSLLSGVAAQHDK